ncbi:hypothetical protein BKA70DRAFT_1356692 [Coprinopsis sp. MPI-PUGE-AT-0042]|nr:hypothetical protein BKA70DRAFT_1356692 [Coprinopsis sp. MPI-PUGE-AT-0042]
MFWRKLATRVKSIVSSLRPHPPLPVPDHFAGMEPTPTNTNEYTDEIIVYTTYQRPPVHPGREWTRFVCISDTHGRQSRLPMPDGDLEDMAAWLEAQPHAVKVVIGGNHDVGLSTIKRKFPFTITILQRLD